MRKTLLFLLALTLTGCSPKTDVVSLKTINASSVPASITEARATIKVIDCSGCGGLEAAEQMKTEVLKSATISVIDQHSFEGERILSKFQPKILPVFVFDKGITTSPWKSFYGEIFDEKDGEYMLLLNKVGLSIGKELLTPPETNPFDYRISGTVSSPVQITEFSDFQCPFCAKFYKTTYPQILKKYGDKVSFTYKNFPLSNHSQARSAAIAAQCAGRQGKFADMYTSILGSTTKLSAESLQKAASQINLDMPVFNVCITATDSAAEVDKQVQDAQNVGIRGTPSFIINGTFFLGGAYPLENFSAKIDELLKGK